MGTENLGEFFAFYDCSAMIKLIIKLKGFIMKNNKTSVGKRLVCLFIPVLALFSTSASAIQGQRFQDWGGNCETGPNNEAICYLEQVVSRNDQVVMKTVLGYALGDIHPRIFFELPADIAIDKGLELKLDQNRAISFQGHCTDTFCNAGLVLNEQIKQQFLQGRAGTVTYYPQADSDPIAVPISLMGVTAGLSALR